MLNITVICVYVCCWCQFMAVVTVNLWRRNNTLGRNRKTCGSPMVLLGCREYIHCKVMRWVFLLFFNTSTLESRAWFPVHLPANCSALQAHNFWRRTEARRCNCSVVIFNRSMCSLCHNTSEFHSEPYSIPELSSPVWLYHSKDVIGAEQPQCDIKWKKCTSLQLNKPTSIRLVSQQNTRKYV